MNKPINALQQLQPDPENSPKRLSLLDKVTVDVYPNSIHIEQVQANFIARDEHGKHFWVFAGDEDASQGFEGERYRYDASEMVRCPLNHQNAVELRRRFAFTRPQLIGPHDSFGYGDRLGLANPAHARIAKQFKMRAILAQQSIRELQRTQRKPEEVMDAATWAVFQEGYRTGFGADADHLKTTEDIDLMVKAGFTFFTIDPSAYVVNEADTLAQPELVERCRALPWQELDDSFESFVARYENKSIAISDQLKLSPNREQVLRGLTKYGGVIAHTIRLYRYLKDAHPSHPAEFELSVDETESVTTPFEHFLVSNELVRRDVELVSLAPRFVGDFEKGIDYKGDVNRFQQEYLKHVQVAEKLGPYKISIHSGSDKFSVYKAIGSLNSGHVHVKTAGTSYLEALRTIAEAQPALFQEILDFSRGLYETEKSSYHVSASLDKVPASGKLATEELVELFEQDDARQILHVTFGKVLTGRVDSGGFRFRERILKCLERCEDKHYRNLIRHFQRHLQPFAARYLKR